MEEVQNLATIKKRAIFSVMSLFFLSGYSAFLGLGANLILTILLSPSIFGIYITVLSIISILNYFSDIGLAASLIQKKDITDDDLATAFTLQQALIITVITFGFLISQTVKRFYGLPIEGVYLYWSLLLGFFISSLKTIPSVLLERKIQFQKIVFVQMIENTVFYFTVSILAVLRFGLFSFTFAVVLRSVVGLVVIYSISFWMPKIRLVKTSLKHLLSFGIPFQTNSLLALVKDDFMILFLGKILGFEMLGYIGWAKKWAEPAIRIVMDNISRVLFPVISRIQDDREKVGRLIEKILYYQALAITPIMIGMVVLMPKFIKLVPKYDKWSPALIVFYLLTVSSFLSSYSTPFINLFNALGKVKFSFFFMILWTVLTWALTPILTLKYKMLGFPITQVVLSLTFIFVLLKARQLLRFNFIIPVYRQIIASGLMLAVLIFYAKLPLPPLVSFLSTIAVGGLSYFLFLLILFKINIISEIKSLVAK